MTSDTKSNDSSGIDSDTIPLDPPTGWPGVKDQRSKKTAITDVGHESGLEQAESEPKQDIGDDAQGSTHD